MKKLQYSITIGVLSVHALTAGFASVQDGVAGTTKQASTPKSFSPPLMLGVSSRPVDPYRPGLVVEHVLSGGTADTAGILIGDVLLSFDDQQLFHPWQLRGLTNSRSVGDRIQLQFLRKGAPQSVQLTLTDWAAKRGLGATQRLVQLSQATGLESLTPQIRTQLLDILNRDEQQKSAPVIKSAQKSSDEAIMGASVSVAYQNINLNKGDIRIAIDDGQIGKVVMKNDKLYLVVRDAKGEVTFEGFCHTVKEIYALPIDFQNTVRTLQMLDFSKHIKPSPDSSSAK